jgi:hypothetical protein
MGTIGNSSRTWRGGDCGWLDGFAAEQNHQQATDAISSASNSAAQECSALLLNTGTKSSLEGYDDTAIGQHGQYSSPCQWMR